jgi:protein-L-isoaspartate(D-aspartate) O-methyltransferase
MNLQNVEQARFNMIEQQIRPWNLADDAVLKLMADVKREDFVPPAYKSLAFADMEIPLADGERMLSPKLQARLLQDAAVQPTDKVLEIGTGSGFLTTLLARQAQRVISLEINPGIATTARANLQKAGVHNFEVRQTDGAKGAPAEAPFDVIVLNGSVTEVPQVLLDQLKIGGRLVAIVGREPVMFATVIIRTAQAQFKSSTKWETVAPALQHFPQSSTFTF